VFLPDQSGGELKDWIPLIVAVIAATAVLIGYFVNSSVSRRLEKARDYADALTAVYKYRQMPFTFKRRHDSKPETRAELATMIGDIQVRLAFYRRWLELDSPDVGAAYNCLVDKIREKNSTFRKEALSSPAVSSDTDIEIGTPYQFGDQAELEKCVALMRRELKLFKWPK
jgi:hypothetical protein